MPTVTGKANSFINFSRPGAAGGGATVIDSDGKIKWAPHNLLLASEQFDASAWNKSDAGRCIVTANTQVAPNGTTTADTIAADWPTVSGVRYYTSRAVSAAYTISVFAKAGTHGFLAITDFAVTGAPAAWFNLSTGVKGTVQSGLSADMIPAGNGWYLCSVTGTTASSIANNLFDICGTVSDNSKTPVIGNTIHLWGAHLYRADLGGMQGNASAYPMYNPSTPRNLLGYSEDFSNGWTRNGILAFGSGSTLNAVAAPNGSLSADLITEDTSTGNHRVYTASASSVGAVQTFSFYAKAAGRNIVSVTGAGLATGSNNVQFNLSNGTSTNSGTNPTAIPQIVPAGNGWYRCAVTYTITGTAGFSIGLDDQTGFASGNPDTSTGPSYTGDGTSGIYLWGAQLSDSASLDPYVPSFGAAPAAAAYYGPRLDHDPAGVSFVENLGAELFQGGTVEVAASGSGDNPSYSGGAMINSAVGTVALSPVFSWSIPSLVAGKTYKVAVSVTGDARLSSVILGGWGNAVSYSADGRTLNAYITAMPGGTRLWISTDGRYTFTMTPTISVKEVVSVSSVGVVTPRGLLVEEQRTNLAVYSADFTNGSWASGSLTKTGNTTVAPDGSMSGDTLIRRTTGSSENNVRFGTTMAVSTPYTFSVFAKAGSPGARLYLRNLAVPSTNLPNSVVQFDLGAGVVSPDYGSDFAGKISMVPVGGGWYRCSMTGTTGSTITVNAVDIGVSDGPSSVGGVAGDFIYVWGAQLEAGSFPTSYIPTGAASATRGSDLVSLGASQFPYSASESTFVVAFDKMSTGLRGGVVSLADITSASSQSSNLDANSDGRMRAFLEIAADTPFIDLDIGTYTANTVQKAAIAYKLNDANAAANGVIAGADDTSVALPAAANNLQIGAVRNNVAAAVLPLNGHIRQITYLPRRISNAELQARTAA